MKRKITLSLTFLMLGIAPIFGQDVSGFERVYYSAPNSVETDDYTLDVKNAVAQFDHCKLSMKITNNTTDFLLYKSKESKFKYPFGEKKPTVKPIYIKPNGSKTRTLQVNGGEQFLQQRFSVEMGGLYRIPLEGTVTEAPDFKLPASTNSFTVGDFKVVMKKYDASTREAKAVFECTYMGNDVAVVNPSNLSVRVISKKTNEELVYANDAKVTDPQILNKGDKIKFSATFHIEGRIVDMQFATMHIVWNDTFAESEEIPLSAETMDFEMDEELTRSKK
ncbi:MAG: hypothetical protein QNK23_06265 [Crocinitomicaceae bacterium]|nr:hypothetical protein [Crocinitomicaceae bacterium]